MPVEDWIEKWTQIQTKEMERIEQQHGSRMDKIEKSVESLNEKMDILSDKVDKKMDSLAESIRERNEKHAIDLAIIKTKLAFYAAAAGIIAGACVAWAVDHFSN